MPVSVTLKRSRGWSFRLPPRGDVQGHTALLGELDGVACEVQQNLTDPGRVAHEFLRQRRIDKHSDLDAAFESAGRRQIRHAIGHVLKIEATLSSSAGLLQVSRSPGCH